jgi:arylsulfatase A
MSRTAIVLLPLLLLLTACAREPDAPAAVEPPNIIYILADDLGYGELGIYGQKRIRTPNIDRLAREGMRFNQHYSGSPVCAPSRAALLTGLHTGHGYVRDNYELGGFTDEEERGQLPLKPGTFTLGRMLQQVGYQTAIIGKWGLGGPGSTGVPNDQGFDYFYGYLDQKQAHNYYPTHLWRNRERAPLANEYFSPHQRLDGEPTAPGEYARFAGTEYAPDVMNQEALAFLRENQDRRFFLYLAYPLPHLALQVPSDSIGEYVNAFIEHPYLGEEGYLPHPRPRAAYAAMITRLDRYVGEVMDELKALGLDSRTLVFFTSDNGPTYTGGADTEFFDSNRELRGLKGSVYEGGIRVPFIARWPGQINAGSASGHISAFWDMMPTLAELTGADTPDGLDGISMLPTLLGKPGQREHDYLYWEYHGLWNGAQAVRMGRWKGVRLGGHDDPEAPMELYDLQLDVRETENVAAQHPDIVEKIAAIMASRTPSEIEGWRFAGLNEETE